MDGESQIQTPKSSHFLPISILIAAVLVAGSIFYAAAKKSAVGNAPVATPVQNQQAAVSEALSKPSERDVILGNADAPVTLIEYGDYQCPYCGSFFEQTEPVLRENYIKTGKVKMVYRNFMVVDGFPGNKNESHMAALAAECAKDQKQFWAYHDALYTAEAADGKENSGNLTRDLFLKIAQDLKLNTADFLNCFDSRKYAKDVQKEMDDAQLLGVRGTPTIFVNGGKVQGDLFQAIDSFINSE